MEANGNSFRRYLVFGKLMRLSWTKMIHENTRTETVFWIRVIRGSLLWELKKD
jgi:hypothetical protein